MMHSRFLLYARKVWKSSHNGVNIIVVFYFSNRNRDSGESFSKGVSKSDREFNKNIDC